MTPAVNSRVLIIVWSSATLLAIGGVRFALRDWLGTDRFGTEVFSSPIRVLARTGLGMFVAMGSVFTAMWITARMRGGRGGTA